MTMETRKFWCHYIGSDGNTPKRRNMELTPIGDIFPAISNNGVKTPIWVEIDFGSRYYCIYAQLSDKVAVYTLEMMGFDEAEKLNQTDEDIDREYEKHIATEYSPEALKYHPMSEERISECKASWRRSYDDRKRWRDKRLSIIRALQDYGDYLLSGHWVTNAALRAFKEAQSPIYLVLEHLRNVKLEEREARERERQEEDRKRREEEARKKAEAEAKELERLNGEEARFRNGEKIGGSDVVTLCRRYGIAIHLRTVHNLQQVIHEINGKGNCTYYRQRGKRTPVLDGCYKTATGLYNYLQTH